MTTVRHGLATYQIGALQTFFSFSTSLFVLFFPMHEVPGLSSVKRQTHQHFQSPDFTSGVLLYDRRKVYERKHF